MNHSTSYYLEVAAGIFTVVLVTILIVTIIFKISNKDGRYRTEYDERQKLVRGEGYKISFFVLVGYMLLMMAADAFGCRLPAGMGIIAFTGIVISISVHCTYCIWKDAYWGLNNIKGRYLIVMFVAGALNMGIALYAAAEGRMLTGGMLQGTFQNLLAGGLLIEIGIVLALRHFADKREEGGEQA